MLDREKFVASYRTGKARNKFSSTGFFFIAIESCAVLIIIVDFVLLKLINWLQHLAVDQYTSVRLMKHS